MSPLKNLMYNSRRRNFRVSDTALHLKGLSNDDIWFTDPVFILLILSVYRRIAEGVKRLVSNMKKELVESAVAAVAGGAGSRGGGRSEEAKGGQ
jgi:hypothetical protein